jgi:hypothetical protein
MIDVAALTAILQRHDPAHVAWVGDDEYDIESIAILERLFVDPMHVTAGTVHGIGSTNDTMEAPEVAALLQQVFARTFHPSMVPGADDAVWREIAVEMMHDQRP